MHRTIAVTALVAALLGLAGCSFNRSNPRQESVLTKIGGSGQLIQPKRCVLKVVTLSRPIRDEALNDALWSVADEQSIAPETRRALEANGLRAGVVSGDLPAKVDAVLNAPPPNKVEPAEFDLPDGDRTQICLSDSAPEVSLLLTQEGRALGKDYNDASGWFRMSAHHDGATAVRIRLVPEIHHGPRQRAFGAVPNAGTFAPQQFMQKDGQQEENLRELAVSLVLQPGQAAIVGCRPESTRSLGAFLFSQAEPNSDRQLQKVLIIWATRSTFGLPGNGGTPPAGLEPVEPPS